MWYPPCQGTWHLQRGKTYNQNPAAPKCSSSQFPRQTPSYFIQLPIFAASCSDINFTTRVKGAIQNKVSGTLVLIPSSSQAL